MCDILLYELNFYLVVKTTKAATLLSHATPTNQYDSLRKLQIKHKLCKHGFLYVTVVILSKAAPRMGDSRKQQNTRYLQTDTQYLQNFYLCSLQTCDRIRWVFIARNEVCKIDKCQYLQRTSEWDDLSYFVCERLNKIRNIHMTIWFMIAWSLKLVS
jgi:hypothetical protein